MAIPAMLAGAGAAITAMWPDAAPPAPTGPQPALPVLIANLATADRIEIKYGERLLWLERRGQVWGMPQQGGYPARPDRVAALIDGLLGLTLVAPATGAPESLGVADESSKSGSGTLVRVLAVSGAVLAAMIVQGDSASEPPIVRRPNDPQAWVANRRVVVPTNLSGWIDPHLPLPDGLADPALRDGLAQLVFTAVRASPLVHPAPERSIQLTLADGTAVLALGTADGQDWLQISGTARWALRLAPYAFAIPPNSLPPGPT
ncbi:hypothetical protein [Acidisphaera sp. L21]|uniref:hypothetical protein n=1 Tax=Acidisphaera sp. L21 TaxID=1641851 RepID=UPI00131B1119|nr:hypothetical protein [Acidisphaera sp. L21]